MIELITPVAMEKGLRFAIREGGHTVGAGTISGDCSVKRSLAVVVVGNSRSRRAKSALGSS